jgi:hypothetical protein
MDLKIMFIGLCWLRNRPNEPGQLTQLSDYVLDDLASIPGRNRIILFATTFKLVSWFAFAVCLWGLWT